MKKLIFILPLFFTLNSSAGEQLFLQANSEYANENYSTAIFLYDSILANGLESAELYYNLGNCHYKTQNLANSIWHYEKSLQFGKKEKTTHNLALARLKIIDRIEPLPQL
ncbi:MAG: tetratricopeptide repeat protein, partial [Flavobacteriales bacterium]|nr:tetratricopeptide repeat protein [Flavobacteriales bacterium]